ncbi:MAG: hypothetical protein WC139_09930 [Candidatus Kapaibacterium sp.]
MIEIAGIKRKVEFSPHHVSNDFLIMQETAEELRKFGVKVTIYNEEDLFDVEIREDYIFSMVQSPEGSNKLLDIAKNKIFVLNTPESVINCYRYNMNRIMEENNIPFPKNSIIDTGTKDFVFVGNFKNKVWIKRSDAHAVQKEDVVYLDSLVKVKYIFNEFRNRGLQDCVIQNHIEGNTVKFYSVYGSDLFYFYTTDLKYCVNFNEERLKNIANKAARALGLEVFGGDAIITEDSEIIIVDMNDWPSFAPVREKASKEIAKLIINKVYKYQNQS